MRELKKAASKQQQQGAAIKRSVTSEQAAVDALMMRRADLLSAAAMEQVGLHGCCSLELSSLAKFVNKQSCTVLKDVQKERIVMYLGIPDQPIRMFLLILFEKDHICLNQCVMAEPVADSVHLCNGQQGNIQALSVCCTGQNRAPSILNSAACGNFGAVISWPAVPDRVYYQPYQSVLTKS